MRAAHRLFCFRLIALVALGLSTALLVDYVSLDPSFCSAESGCGALRRSGLGYLPIPGVGTVPLPLFGVLTFAAALGISILRSPLARRRFATPLGWALGFTGGALLALQAYLGSFCVYCVIVDLSCLAIGLLTFSLGSGGWERATFEETSELQVVEVDRAMAESRRIPGVWGEDSRIYTPPTPLVRPAPKDPLRLESTGWALLALLAFLGPWLYPTLAKKSAAPEAIQALYVPGKLNVVEFFDFECPHCRALAPTLDRVLAEYGDRVHLVRRHAPLDGHPNARPAARFALCAEEQGRGEAVTHAYLTSDVLEEPRLRELALAAGVDGARFEECLRSKRPDARLEEDRARIEAAGFEGLPTTYVGGIRILGAREDVVYRDALERVARGDDERGVPPLVYWASFAALVVGAFVLFKKNSPTPPGSSPAVPARRRRTNTR